MITGDVKETAESIAT